MRRYDAFRWDGSVSASASATESSSVGVIESSVGGKRIGLEDLSAVVWSDGHQGMMPAKPASATTTKSAR